jgi:hypothetical protein
MTISLKVQEILIWHDTPQLFTAKDKIGGLYVCLAVDDKDGQSQFLAVAISTNRLQELKTGQIDLYTVFASPELETWFLINDFENDTLTIEPFSGEITESWLPIPGEFLPQAALLSPETFAVVKVGAVAKEAGMNPTLLRQYLSGAKRPSREQALRVQNALHRVARQLLDIRLV